MGVLGGVCMEIDDCALPLVTKVVATADPNVAFKVLLIIHCLPYQSQMQWVPLQPMFWLCFKDADAAFMVGAMPRKEGMERKDLLACNVKIFKVQGQALDQVCSKSHKNTIVKKFWLAWSKVQALISWDGQARAYMTSRNSSPKRPSKFWLWEIPPTPTPSSCSTTHHRSPRRTSLLWPGQFGWIVICFISCRLW